MERLGKLPQRSILIATILVAAALAPQVIAVGSPDSPALAGIHDNVAFYSEWHRDLDGDKLDDRIEREIAEGATGDVLVHVHYDRRPTADDATLLTTVYGASATYVMHNWDDIQAFVPYATVAGTADAPGVVAVERVDESRLSLEVALPATRLARSTGTVSDHGINHGVGVRETLGLRGEGMVIAVMDTGIDNTHASLDDLDDDDTTFDPKLVHKIDPANGQVLWGGVDSSDGFVIVECIDPPDNFSHGSHVAGIAAGTAAGAPEGAAPGAKLVDVSVADVPVTSPVWIPGVILGLDWVLDFNAGNTCFGDPGEDRIDVLTISLVFSEDPKASVNRKLTDVVRSGIVATIAAGNPGSKAEDVEGAEGAIVVANSDDRGTIRRNDDTLNPSSGRGPRQHNDGDLDTLDEMRPDIAAPGTNINAPLVGSRALAWSQTGTSMATPLVAGIVALMLEANPALAPVDMGSNEAMGLIGAVPVRDVLQATASYRETAATKVQHKESGKFGLPWNNGWGYGLVDAYGAVLAGMTWGSDARPTACFTTSVTDGNATYDASCSSDDNAISTYVWHVGNDTVIATTTATLTHSYEHAGMYNVRLIVRDTTFQHGSTNETVVVGDGGGGNGGGGDPGTGEDPDTTVPNLTDGAAYADTAPTASTNGAKFYKIKVPAGSTSLTVQLDGDACAPTCRDNLDLHVKKDGKPAQAGDCSVTGTGNSGTCTLTLDGSAGWWYVQVVANAIPVGISFTFTGPVAGTAYEVTATIA